VTALHVVSLPHTRTNGEYATCAYTTKVERFCRMMTGAGRDVILYSPEGNTAPCDEHVAVVTAEQQERWFGSHDLGDLERGGFDWNPSSPWWSEMNGRTIGEIGRRRDPRDLLCLIAGQSQQVIADSFMEMTVAEFGVGYEGIILRKRPNGLWQSFSAFESHSHRHLVYGLQGWRRGREYDTVIPNFFDPEELPAGDGDGGYLLFVGRLIMQKGVATAAQVAQALGMPLVVAGPGATDHGDGWVRYPEGEARCDNLLYVGAVGVSDRARLMGGAAVLLAPTVYVEPFGGVAVEAMMCGTPAVTTDWGAFTETVHPGVSGYRFQTLQEAVDATEAAAALDRDEVRRYALNRYSLDAVRPMYGRWFDNLDGLWSGGWSALRAEVGQA
jgi:glycosyltransferase involved in cell wall biosynthesis